MKRVLSILALALVVVGLVGCMDSPDIGNKKPANYGQGANQQKG